MLFKITVKDKEVSAKELWNYIRKLANWDYYAKIEKYYINRTTSQNAYYWKCLEIMWDDLWYTQKELHQVLSSMFLMDNNWPLPKIKSTTELTIKEFIDYIECIAVIAAQNGILLPHPEYK